MLFLFSLLIAAAFSVFCGKALRKHPAPFYLAAAALSIGTVYLANQRLPEMPVFVRQNVIALFTKGILAAAFWAVVMWTGALPNGSALMKKLMPQRGQLSVFAAILTLGHAVGLGIRMLPRWIEKSDTSNLAICIALMLIMLPLTVISVQKIRRKMKAKTWKSVQRSAYLFYALIPVHVIALNLARIRRGRTEMLPDLAIYVTVFFGYAVCRLNKWYRVKRKPEHLTGLRLASWGLFLIGMTVFAAAVSPKKAPATAPPAANAEVEEITAADEPAATSAAATDISAESTAASATETDITEITEETSADTTSEIRTENTTYVSEPAETVSTSAAAEPVTALSGTKPASATSTTASVQQTVRVYRNGTFTAKAYGYDGDITVHVTIQDDRITDISAETEESDDEYFYDAKTVVIPAIIRSQAADVDACSGATYSSKGIITAVRAALESAKT
ncbi:MAG: FMN-binding protein [Oscillospiraceae bacterium]|nr:FMN-binding protein [Oscillospiraceae bacterium]